MISIRAFMPTDIPHVLRVVKESLGENYPPSLYLTIHNLWREGFLVLLDGGVVQAFVAAVPSGSKVARVLMLAVSVERRRRSFGQMLMKELYIRASEKGIDTIVLEVRKSNRSALSFYKLQGFTIEGEIKSFYSNGEDAYKMMKILMT